MENQSGPGVSMSNSESKNRRHIPMQQWATHAITKYCVLVYESSFLWGNLYRFSCDDPDWRRKKRLTARKLNTDILMKSQPAWAHVASEWAAKHCYRKWHSGFRFRFRFRRLWGHCKISCTIWICFQFVVILESDSPYSCADAGRWQQIARKNRMKANKLLKYT